MNRRAGLKSVPPLSVAAVTIAALAATALAGELKRRSVTAPLPADGTGHLGTAQCPAGSKATGGGGEVQDPFHTVDVSFPSAPRAWTASGLHGGNAGPSKLTVHVVCVEGGRIVTRTSSVTPPTNVATPRTVRCPVGARATGGGIEVDPDEDVSLGSFPSGRRAWTAVGATFEEENPVTAHVLCIKRRKVRHRERTRAIPADGVAHGLTVRCPKRSKPTGGGVEISPPSGEIINAQPAGSHPTGRRGWTASVLASQPDHKLTAHVLCLVKRRR